MGRGGRFSGPQIFITQYMDGPSPRKVARREEGSQFSTINLTWVVCICKQSDKWTDDNNHRFAKYCHRVFCSGQVDTFLSTAFFAIGQRKLIWCSVRYLSEIVNVHQQFVCIVREFLGRTMARKSACHCYKQRLDVIKYYNIPTVLCVWNISLSQLYIQHCGGWTGGQSNVCKIRYDNLRWIEYKSIQW